MSEKPFVSIVIPAFNHVDYVSRSIESVIEQSFQDWELIVIDDGSTDGTSEVVAAYADLPRVHVIHQKNCGLTPTLNRALQLSRGEFFNFLPSDDYFHPSKLEAQVKAIHEQPDLDVVFCNQILINSTGAPIQDGDVLSWTCVPFVRENEILPALFERNFIPAPSALVRTERIRSAGSFDESLVYAQDYDLWLRLLPTCRALWLHEPLIYYRWHGKNLTYTAEEPVHIERAYLLTKALRILDIKDIYPRLKGLPEGIHDTEAAKCCLELANHLVISGLLEMLPWAQILVQQARGYSPQIRAPLILQDKLNRRAAFMDLRDCRLQRLAEQVGGLCNELERFRQEVPDILAERRELSVRAREQSERERSLNEQQRSLNQWNQSLDEKLEWLNGYHDTLKTRESDLESRKRKLDRLLSSFPARLAMHLIRSFRGLRYRMVSIAFSAWKKLPISVRARFGPVLKRRLAEVSAPDRADLLFESQKHLVRSESAVLKPHSGDFKGSSSFADLVDSCPLVSVVLPIYNHANTARLAIESVLLQRYPNIQLIVVNDGSTDDLEEVLAPYVGHPRIKILSQPNQKLPRALTNGFRFADGDYFTWTSADNIMLPNQVETLVDFLVRHPRVDMTYSNVEIIDENGDPLVNSDYRIHNQSPKGSNRLSLPREVVTLSSLADNFINASFLYTRAAGRALGPYDPRLLGTEDYDYWLRMNALFVISKLDSEEILYQYRVHRNSLSERYGASHIVNNVQQLIAAQDARVRFYARKFCVLLLLEAPLMNPEEPAYRLGLGFLQQAGECYLVTPDAGEERWDGPFPHIRANEAMRFPWRENSKYVLWAESPALTTLMLDTLADKDLWVLRTDSCEESAVPSTELTGLKVPTRYLQWDGSENREPHEANQVLTVPRPIAPDPVLRKVRDNQYEFWELPWPNGRFILYWGNFDDLDHVLVESVIRASRDDYFIFTPSSDDRRMKKLSFSEKDNVQATAAKNAEQILPLLSSASCLWAPVLQGRQSAIDDVIATAHAAGRTLVAPRWGISPGIPYCYGYDDSAETVKQLSKAQAVAVDTKILDDYLDKHSPVGVAGYILAVANNDLCVERECGISAFDAPMPVLMRLPKGRPTIALEIPTMDRGGMEEVVANLALHFDKLRFDPIVMCVDNGGLEAERILSAGGKIEFLSRNVSRYGTFLNERSVVLVNTHYSEFGLDLAAKRSIPVVATIHNAYVWFGKTERDAFRANDGKVAHYISVSSNVKRYLVDRLGVADNKVTIIPNGVDTVRLSLLRQLPPKVTRDSLGIGPNDFVFLNIASLDGRKNHHAIISAVERLASSYPNLKVICAGNVVSPPYFEGLKRRVALGSLEERILFPGFVRPVADLYRLADAFLLPSIVEGWSMAMTEAMYFGLPMVLTDVGGARDVLDKPGMGVLVSNSFGEVTALGGENLGRYTEAPSPSNLDELCEAMQDMMSHPDYWRGFAEERRHLVESEYTLEKVIKETVSIFSNYLSRPAIDP